MVRPMFCLAAGCRFRWARGSEPLPTSHMSSKTSVAIWLKPIHTRSPIRLTPSMPHGVKRRAKVAGKKETARVSGGKRQAQRVSVAGKSTAKQEKTIAGARRNFCVILAELIRLDVIGIRQLTDATDIHRLTQAAHILRKLHVGPQGDSDHSGARLGSAQPRIERNVSPELD
jgi:hypothetical protein